VATGAGHHASPAYRDGGLIVITFDEGSGTAACCGENSGLGPSHPSVPLPGKTGPGGGRIGSVLLSPLISPGTVSTVPYNHYSLLRTIEDISACRTWATRPCRSQVLRPGRIRLVSRS
jgi:phosphatidylinositol-3-phosphatase